METCINCRMEKDFIGVICQNCRDYLIKLRSIKIQEVYKKNESDKYNHGLHFKYMTETSRYAESIAQSVSQWRKEANRISKKKYVKDNPDKIKFISATYRANNKDKIKARNAEYYFKKKIGIL